MDYNEKDIRTMVENVLKGLGASAAPGASTGSCCADPFPVEVSARHVHVTKEAAEILFGKGYELHRKKMLSQPGEFLAEERVKLVTPKGQIENVAVLGPERKAVQVELSATDAKSLGLKAPVNLSGDLSGAADVLIMGPAGCLQANGSVIIAKAHLHLTPADAQHYGLSDGQIVSVRVDSPRPITFDGVVARVRSDMALAMHIDFDEANAGMIGPDAVGRLAACGCAQTGPAAVPAVQPATAKRTFTPQWKAPYPSPTAHSRKLITEADARQMKAGIERGGTVRIPKGTIVTPAARDIFTNARIKLELV